MADYTTTELVKSQFKSLEYNANTLAEPEVAQWIVEETAYINSRVGVKYTVPIIEASSPQSFEIMKTICTWLVAQRVKDTLAVKTPVKEVRQQTIQGGLRKAAEMRLNMILEEKLLLPDAPKAPENTGVSSFASDNNLEPVFRKGDPSKNIRDQW